MSEITGMRDLLLLCVVDSVSHFVIFGVVVHKPKTNSDTTVKVILELLPGLEPGTSSLPRTRSTD